MGFGIATIDGYFDGMKSAQGRLFKKQEPYKFILSTLIVLIIGLAIEIASWLFQAWLAIQVLKYFNFI